MSLSLPALNFEYHELEPHIDSTTMEIHHGKHHQAYISKYIGAVEGTPLEQKKVSDVLADLNSVPCLLYTSPSPRDKRQSRMPSSA